MDPRSEANLAHVEPSLAAVMRAAAQTPQPFQVTYGIRDKATEAALVAKHFSTTMHSRHLPDKNGLAAAVDITCFVDGAAVEVGPEVEHVYTAASLQIKAAAKELGIDIEWGGDWHTFKDWGHYQRPWKECP